MQRLRQQSSSMPISAIFVSAFLLSTLTAAHAQQTEATADGPATVVKATTHLVLVDVIADDGHGHPVTDLKQEDYTITEDGKDQKVRSMVFQQPSTVKQSIHAPLPPNTFTNK